MSKGLSAHLAYGYVIHTDEDGWRVEEGEDFTPAWAEDSTNWNKEATCLLAENLAGESPESIRDLAEYQVEEKLKDRTGLRFVMAGRDFSYLLLVCSPELERYSSNPYIELPVHDEQWDVNLAWALEVLGLRPDREKPSWLLMPEYG